MRAIVTVGHGAWYPRGAIRLLNSVREHGLGQPGKVFAWIDDLPPGGTRENVKAGKALAILEASKRGARYVYWLDASCWAVASLAPLFERLERDGYALMRHAADYRCADWCADTARDVLQPVAGVPLEEVAQLKGCIVGLDLGAPVGREFLDAWVRLAPLATPRCLPSGLLSSRPTFKAHRFQCVQSVIAHSMGLTLTAADDLGISFPPHFPPLAGVHCVAARGM